MSEFKRLIDEFCPNGVEYKAIGDICDVFSGGDVPKEHFSKEKNGRFNVPIISNGIAENALYGYTDYAKINEPAVTVSARGTIGYAEYRDYSYYPIIRLLSVISKNKLTLDTKYLYYCLERKKYKVQMSGIPQLTVPNLKLELIPVPPIEIQREIVCILDSFTEYISLLEKELGLRKKQYSYYRNYFLDFGNDVEYKTLGEVATLSRGVRVVRNQLEITGNIPVYQNSIIPLGYYEKSNCKSNTTFIIGAGSAGEIGFSSVDFWAADDCYYFTCSEKITDKFLYYALLNKYTFIKSQVRKSSIPRLERSVLEKIKIPVPPIEEQEKIVKILDTFREYIELRSRNIELRKKQYKYCRDLIFKELK